MRHLLLLLLAFVTLSACGTSEPKLKEGDIVFQNSKSSQSPMLTYATGSVWTHCGIVVEKNKKLYVLEASNVVKLTPIKEWEKRGRFEKMISFRVKDKPMKVKYKKYLGQRYDLAFKFNNGKMYCSELVWEIYKEQFGIELCKPRPIKDYCTFGLASIMKRRKMSMNALVVAPSDLVDSDLLKRLD